MYDVTAESIVTVDAMVAFYLELYDHFYGSVCDLVCTKLATLFKSNHRDTVQGADLTR